MSMGAQKAMTRKDLSPGDIFSHTHSAGTAFICLPGVRQDGYLLCACLVSDDHHDRGVIYGTMGGGRVFPCVADFEEEENSVSGRALAPGALAISKQLGEIVLKVGELHADGHRLFGMYMPSSGNVSLLDEDSMFGLVKFSISVRPEEPCAK